MASSSPEVSVIVPVRDAPGQLAQLLACLSAQTDAPAFEVILVDDGSRESLVPVAEASSNLDIHIHPLSEPGSPALGPGQARDYGLSQAVGEIVAFTDADCLPAPGWLAAISRALSKQSAVVQGPITLPEQTLAGPFDRVLVRPEPSPLFETANLAARLSDVLRAGGFSGGHVPDGGKELGEDVALGLSLLRSGIPLLWVPEAHVEHPVEPRDWQAAAIERSRSGAFCKLVAQWPELRGMLLHRKLFLGRDRPRTWLAVLGIVGVLVSYLPLVMRAQSTRRRSRLISLLLLLPYLRLLDQRSRGWGRSNQPRVAAGLAAGDLVACRALAQESWIQRTPVL